MAGSSALPSLPPFTPSFSPSKLAVWEGGSNPNSLQRYTKQDESPNTRPLHGQLWKWIASIQLQDASEDQETRGGLGLSALGVRLAAWRAGTNASPWPRRPPKANFPLPLMW